MNCCVCCVTFSEREAQQQSVKAASEMVSYEEMAAFEGGTGDSGVVDGSLMMMMNRCDDFLHTVPD